VATIKPIELEPPSSPASRGEDARPNSRRVAGWDAKPRRDVTRSRGPARLVGLFLPFEGPEGAGKSTQVDLLANALAGRAPLVVREPGGTPLGEEIRRLLLHGEPVTAEAEMLLFMAARAELVEMVIPGSATAT